MTAIRYLKGPPYRVEMGRLRLIMRVGAGDAAATAVLCGLAYGLLGLCVTLTNGIALQKDPPEVMVQPEFTAWNWHIRARCILRTRFGHLMVAVVLAVAAAVGGAVQGRSPG